MALRIFAAARPFLTPLRLAAAAAPLVVVLGCGTDRPSVIAQSPPPSAAQPASVDTRPLARMQKAEVEKPEPAPRTPFSTTGDAVPTVPDGRVAVQILAQVGGTPILYEDVKNASPGELMKARTEAERKQILRREVEKLIDREVVLQDLYERLKKKPQVLQKLKDAAAKEFEKYTRLMKAGAKPPLKSDDELRAVFAAQGLSLDSYRLQSERSFMAREYMHNRIYGDIEKISHEQIVEYYDQHANEFVAEDRVEWQDIFIDASKYASRGEGRQIAEQVAARAKAGEDFTKLYAKYDNGLSSFNKNSANALGSGQKRGEIQPPQAETIVFQLQEGQVGPVIEMGTGFHVVRVAKREYAGRMPMNEKVQTEIRRKLQNDTAERAMKHFVNELKRKAIIQIAGDLPPN
jgi:hypothetical protein